MIHRLPLTMVPQPDATACGPTCLHALYRFLGREIALSRIAGEIRRGSNGGSFASSLAHHALVQGMVPTLHTCNIEIFDPTWFHLGTGPLLRRLRKRIETLPPGRTRVNGLAYEAYLRGGGRVRFEPPRVDLFRDILSSGHPILTGLSHTWFNRAPRENDRTGKPDGIHGAPVGHFVMLHGYDDSKRRFLVADPDGAHSGSKTHRWAPEQHLLASIFLGSLTHDTDFFYLNPPRLPKGKTP